MNGTKACLLEKTYRMGQTPINSTKLQVNRTVAGLLEKTLYKWMASFCMTSFFSDLSFSVIFGSGSVRNERYYARFEVFIRVRVVIHEAFK